jgi:hypothetical protein
MNTTHKLGVMDADERLLRDAHNALGVTWGSTAEREVQPFRLQRMGFADIPRLTVEVTCKDKDLSSLIALLRQAAFGWLGERGWSSDHLQFTPSVSRGRTAMFRDDASGAKRRGTANTVSWELSAELAHAVDWQKYGRLHGQLDVRESEA